MSPGLASVVESLCQGADIVIVDAPPMMTVPDVSVLAPRCDVSILVVAHGITTRGELEEAESFLRDHQEIRVLGVAFNRIKLRGRGSYRFYQRAKSLPLGLGSLWRSLRSRWGGARRSRKDPADSINLSEQAEKGSQ
jgi:Mrp family chromosome partitioning ATPase